MRHRSVLITGATGFVGGALVQRLVRWNSQHDAGLKIWAVIRSHSERLTRLAEAGLISGVVRSDFAAPLEAEFPVDLVFHCATPASAEMNAYSPEEMFAANVAAMTWVTTSPLVHSNHPRVVFTSSGAVYGPQPADLERIPEDYPCDRVEDAAVSAYARGKRTAEKLLVEAGERGDLEPVIARLFAFSGVGLPLDRHFAVGNFVNDVRHRRAIRVRGTGATVRSYLDVADMADWLLAIADSGAPGVPYHVGSEEPITIGELAHLVAERGRAVLGWDSEVVVEGKNSPIDGTDRYVPDTAMTRAALGVSQKVSLARSIDEMLTQDDFA